jgi:hypothetical protein
MGKSKNDKNKQKRKALVKPKKNKEEIQKIVWIDFK